MPQTMSAIYHMLGAHDLVQYVKMCRLRACSSLYINLMPRYHSLCEPCTLDPSQTYVAAEETTQHTLPTNDTQFQCIQERGTGMHHSSCCCAVYI